MYKAHGLKLAVKQVEVGAEGALDTNRIKSLYADGESLPQIA